jgi:hypothetical protein
MLGTNTNKGYTFNITAQLQKPFKNGLTANFAYTFGRAMVVNDGTSSQNSSQWRYMEQVNGLNNLDVSYSDFDMGHRVLAFISYRIDYFQHASTTISLVYNGQSGNRYSYVYNDDGEMNGNGESDNNLIYIPASAEEINLIDDGDLTAAQQWADLEAFIDGDDYLSEHKGEYAERNGARLPFEHIFDLRLVQEFYLNVGDKKHTLQATVDIFNLGNLINKDWGRRRFVNYGYNKLINFKGWEQDDDGNDTTIPQYTFDKPDGDLWDIDDSGTSSSRWQAQFGIRYIF